MKETYFNSCAQSTKQFGRWYGNTTALPCFTRMYNLMQHGVMKNREKQIPCNNEVEGSAELLIAYVKRFSDKRAITWNALH